MNRDVSIKLSVSLSDGSFESGISAPISEHIAFEKVASAWLDMMQKALAIVRERERAQAPATAAGERE